ncbi:MAG: CYTH domain-containing protein [Planctomycetota bacterium]|nr:MAG: CYTH domain-containing protein [Planctomycetota bacterium]
MSASRATSHREVECKWRIDGRDQAAACALFCQLAGPPEHLQQRNRFFDTAEGHLRAQATSLRLRQENARLLLTCKRRVAKRDGALHQQQEEESWLNSVLWNLYSEAPLIPHGALPLPPQARHLLGSRPLCNMGGFDNRRLQWHWDRDVLCLDCTDFPRGQREYEIEIELGGTRDQDWWWHTLRQGGIAMSDQSETKLHRYLRLQKEQR